MLLSRLKCVLRKLPAPLAFRWGAYRRNPPAHVLNRAPYLITHTAQNKKKSKKSKNFFFKKFFFEKNRQFFYWPIRLIGPRNEFSDHSEKILTTKECWKMKNKLKKFWNCALFTFHKKRTIFTQIHAELKTNKSRQHNLKYPQSPAALLWTTYVKITKIFVKRMVGNWSVW